MVKFMLKVQARTKSGKAKKKGGDNFEVFVAGPDVCTYLQFTCLFKNSNYFFSFQGNVDVVVTDIKDGSYLVQCSPNQPGEYWFDATLNSNAVNGFPWGLVI